VGGRVVDPMMRRTSHLFVIPAVPPVGGASVWWLDMQDDLVRAVSEELRWDPRIDADLIRVTEDERTITLTGTVRSYSGKCCAEKIAREIRGVMNVRNDLEVRLTIGSYRTDTGLARLTSEILQNHTALCDPLPRISVREGWVTLEGIVTSDVQKRCAEEALRDVAGIRGITNNIVVTPPANGGGAPGAFEAAVRRRAALAVRKLKVKVSGMTMAVYGEVASCAERDALIELASRRKGIARVEDHVVVQPGGGRAL
jgi:osmotically-inducible protein OsmY